MTDCLECEYFMTCESGKQIFHKITGTPCEEFKKEKEDVKSRIKTNTERAHT